jgi:hypothetical protein
MLGDELWIGRRFHAMAAGCGAFERAAGPVPAKLVGQQMGFPGFERLDRFDRRLEACGPEDAGAGAVGNQEPCIVSLCHDANLLKMA